MPVFAARLAKLGHEVHDGGNLQVPVRETVADEKGMHYLAAITRVCKAVYNAAREAVEGDLYQYSSAATIPSPSAPSAASPTMSRPG